MGESQLAKGKRLLLIAVVLGFIALQALLSGIRSKRQASSGSEKNQSLAIVQRRKALFSPMGPPSAKVSVDIYLSFEESCSSCVEEAREIFGRLVKKHKGRVRFRFLDTDEREVRERLASLLKKEGLLGVPPGDVWVFVNGRAKFKLNGKTHILNHLPTKGNPSEKRLERIVDAEVRAAYPAPDSK